MCDNCRSNNDSLSFLAGAVMGAAIGAAVGLLFAPQPGAKTREQITKEALKTMKEVKRNVRTFENEKVRPVVKSAEKSVNAKVKVLKNEVNKVVQDAKKKFGK